MSWEAGIHVYDKLPPVPKLLEMESDEKGPHFMRLRRNIAFPPSRNLNVNMMPFIFGEIESLPPELQGYFPMTMLCHVQDRLVRLHEGGSVKYVSTWDGVRRVDAKYAITVRSDDPTGTVCYLTVQESDVEPDACQRRPGAHTESAGYMKEETGGRLQSESLCPALNFPLPFFPPDSLHSHCVQTHKCVSYNSACGVCVKEKILISLSITHSNHTISNKGSIFSLVWCLCLCL